LIGTIASSTTAAITKAIPTPEHIREISVYQRQGFAGISVNALMHGLAHP